MEKPKNIQESEKYKKLKNKIRTKRIINEVWVKYIWSVELKNQVLLILKVQRHFGISDYRRVF